LPAGIPEGEALEEVGLWAEGAHERACVSHESGEAGVGLTQVSCHQFGKAGIFVIVYDGGVRVARKPDYILDAMALTEG
jgi:hypothetical protein